MTPASLWPDLADRYFRDRLDWADEAFERFRDNLLPEVRDALSKQRSDTDVVLYGTTRAGKSTLALALLGVPDDERFTEVEGILRGRLPAVTESVTIAPTRYVLSDGDHWTFGVGAEPPRPISDDRVEQEIAAIRAEVYAGHWDPNRILHLGIPVRYAPGQDGRSLRLLDLPGARSGKDVERRYVEKLLPSWVEAADTILLVGEAGHQTFLNAAETQIDQLRNWHLLPGRFRVVMTHAYSLLTTMQRVDDDIRAADVDAWRGHMLTELPKNAVIPDVPADRWLHPFDFSESFRKAREGYPGASWPAVLAARNQALAGLRQTLIRASRPETRIRSAYQAGRVVQQIREQQVERLNARVADAERLAQGLQRSLDARCATIAAEEEFLAELARRQDAWPGLAARAGALTVPGAAPELGRVEHDTTAEWRHRLRRALAHEFQNWRTHYGAALGAYPYEASPRGQREAVDNVLKAVRERRRVGRVFAGGRARLVKRVAGEYATAATGLTDLLRRRAEAEAESGRAALAQQIAAATAMLTAAREGLATTEAQGRQALEAVRTEEETRAREMRKLSNAVTAAQRFPGLFIAAYDHRLQTDLARLAALPDPVEQLAAALAIVDAARIFDAIREDDVTRSRHGTAGQAAFDDLIRNIVREPLDEVTGQITSLLKDSLKETEESVRRIHQLVRTVAIAGGVIAALLLAAVITLMVALVS